jgi:hypothetical protein
MQDMAALRSEAFVGGWELDRHIKHKLRICEIDYILRPILEANRLSFPPISLNNYLTIGIIGKCYFFATRKNLNLGVENPIIIASKAGFWLTFLTDRSGERFWGDLVGIGGVSNLFDGVVFGWFRRSELRWKNVAIGATIR